jgi:hypothetical protein
MILRGSIRRNRNHSVTLGVIICLISSIVLPNCSIYNYNISFGQNQKNITAMTNSRIHLSNNTSPEILNISKSNGNLGSIQNDETNNPAWIVVGQWRMIMDKPQRSVGTGLPNSTVAFFNASFSMVKLDGTLRHKHTISDFKLTSYSINKNISATFNGTSTVTMKDGDHTDVPTSITFMDKGAISIWLDPSKTNKHFGNTPIYGIVYRTH